MRSFSRFSYKSADYRISSAYLTLVTDTIIKQREILEKYILEDRNFLNSLIPIPPLPEYAPEIAIIMQKAGKTANVGPMAAVAGTLAQFAAESGALTTAESRALTTAESGALTTAESGVFHEGRGSLQITDKAETIVENGGDIFMILVKELILGIHSGVEALEGKLAFRIKPEDTPLAVCSSSSTMGHSLSLGDCNLATVFSKSGALADAAATRACNLIKKTSDIQGVLDEISALPGISGLMIIKGDSVGMAGDLPEIISNADPEMINKITVYGQISSA